MKSSPKLLIAATVVAIVATAVAVTLYLRTPVPVDVVQQVSLEKMGQLVSMKVNFAEVIELNQALSAVILGQSVGYGNANVQFVLKGDCVIGIDLAKAKTARQQSQSTAGEGKIVELTLPLPRALQPRVNHDSRANGGSYLATTNKSLLVGNASLNRAINQVMTTAQNDVKRACSQPDVIESSRKNAEMVLTALFMANGERPVFHWQ
jgi:hypothetical protein